MRNLGLVVAAVLIGAGVPAMGQMTPGYQQGTVQQVDKHGYQLTAEGGQVSIGSCGKFQSGQLVEFRIDADKVYIRNLDGEKYECPVVETQISGQAVASGYETGKVLGYTVRRDITEKYTRYAKVYEIKGAKLLFLVDYCGSFQSGTFSPGQDVQFRVDVDNDRLYIHRASNQEYSCQLEGMRLTQVDSIAVWGAGTW